MSMSGTIDAMTHTPHPYPSITCPECHRTSYHPEDIRHGYCGACQWWTSDPLLRLCPAPGSTRPGAPQCAGPVGETQPV